ncbi:MAG: IMS domain-containing protein [Microcystaceae cyanobacterium]
MRIPLDYYQILGVNSQETEQKIAQVFEDRRIQCPRREYSDGAIASRQQLLERAYQFLSDTQQRAEYNQKFFSPTEQAVDLPHPEGETDEEDKSSPSSPIPEIELTLEEQRGALLILGELGDYKRVIELGKAILDQPAKSNKDSDFLSDLRLSVALAYTERCREEWQQSAYEAAGQLAHQALETLPQSAKFEKLRAKINQESHLLRPYRILELLSSSDSRVDQRQKGLTLLQTLLDERQGIDGKGEDHSGLNVDSFLSFIQQVRSFLTVEEQVQLFVQEAQRPSYVASYLAIYALLAQGVVNKNPHAIVEGSQMLKTLNKHQDVGLETAICALLLGQTKIANEALQQSQDREALDFISQQSQGSPDLLPGLYVYSKQWLETEVFPHFLDLTNRQVSLTEYFADDNVVSYLESLENEPQPLLETPVEAKQPVGVAMASALKESYPSPSPRRSRRRTSRRQRPSQRDTFDNKQATATLLAPANPTDYTQSSNPIPSQDNPTQKASKVGVTVTPMRRKKKVRRQRKLTFKPLRLLLLIGILGGAIGLLGLGVKSLQREESPLVDLDTDGVSVQLTEALTDIPKANARFILPTGKLNPTDAKDVIETWLYSKALAFGDQYRVEEISSILAPSLAKTWINRAKSLRSRQSYWKYSHEVQVKDLKGDNNRAVVDALVKEVANLYGPRGLNQQDSYNETLKVRYTLKQQQGQWMVAEIKVLD